MTVEQARPNSDAVEGNAHRTTKSESGIHLVQECVAGENAQDYDRIESGRNPAVPRRSYYAEA